jgi:hypothetical protein
VVAYQKFMYTDKPYIVSGKIRYKMNPLMYSVIDIYKEGDNDPTYTVSAQMSF